MRIRQNQIYFALGSNEGRSQAVNTERLVNLFAEQQIPSAKSQAVLYHTAGIKTEYNLNNLSNGNVGILGLDVLKDALFVITRSNIFSIENNKIKKVADLELLGNALSIANNGIDLVFSDGYSCYSYNTSKGLTEILFDTNKRLSSVTFQDGYFIFSVLDTGEFVVSDLYSTKIDNLRFATAEGLPDDVTKVISTHRELWVFGEKSIEVWYNSGDVDFPFDRIQGAILEKGSLAKDTIQKVNGIVTWLAIDNSVYMANGYQPIKISNEAVEYAISQVQNINNSVAWWYTESGHTFYVLTFIDDNKTWVYDFATTMWHERSHFKHKRHIGSSCINYNGMNIIGDYQSNILYHLSMDHFDDNGTVQQRIAQSCIFGKQRQLMTGYSFELELETGQALNTGKGSDPQAMLQWSNDSGKTWSNEYWASIGKIGEYDARCKWNRLGMFRQRTFRITITEPIKVAIISAWLQT